MSLHDTFPSKTDNAIALASKYHFNQKRFGGKPYIFHPLRVYDVLKKWNITDEKILCAALLHDTKEDTKITDEEIIKTCGHDVLYLVNELTFKKTDDYLKKCKSLSNEAKLIKLADIIDNITDLDGYRGNPYKMLEKKILAIHMLTSDVAQYFNALR